MQEALREGFQAPATARLSRWVLTAEDCDYAEGYAWAWAVKLWRPAILALGPWPGGYEWVHRWMPHQNQSAEAPELRVPQPRSL